MLMQRVRESEFTLCHVITLSPWEQETSPHISRNAKLFLYRGYIRESVSDNDTHINKSNSCQTGDWLVEDCIQAQSTMSATEYM